MTDQHFDATVLAESALKVAKAALDEGHNMAAMIRYFTDRLVSEYASTDEHTSEYNRIVTRLAELDEMPKAKVKPRERAALQRQLLNFKTMAFCFSRLEAWEQAVVIPEMGSCLPGQVVREINRIAHEKGYDSKAISNAKNSVSVAWSKYIKTATSNEYNGGLDNSGSFTIKHGNTADVQWKRIQEQLKLFRKTPSGDIKEELMEMLEDYAASVI